MPTSSERNRPLPSADVPGSCITKLVEGHGAERFLREKSWAGKALLDARWALLRRHNVLGLSYTLYAASELSLP